MRGGSTLGQREVDIVLVGPAQFLESAPESCYPRLRDGIAFGISHQYADPAHALLHRLRARRERPGRRRATEKRDELAPPHSITSSAMASSLSGTVRPSILAVSALMTSSNLLACTTGKSAGFAPLRMRPT